MHCLAHPASPGWCPKAPGAVRAPGGPAARVWDLPGADRSPTRPQEACSRKHPDSVVRMGWTRSDLPPAVEALLWGVVLEKGGWCSRDPGRGRPRRSCGRPAAAPRHSLAHRSRPQDTPSCSPSCHLGVPTGSQLLRGRLQATATSAVPFDRPGLFCDRAESSRREKQTGRRGHLPQSPT